MRRNSILGCVTCSLLGSLVLLASSSNARADPLPLAEASAPLTQHPNAWQVSLATAANLSSDRVLKPLVLSPDAAYGVLPRLEVGLFHSSKRQNGFSGLGEAHGLCLTGSDSGCAQVYEGPALLARYQLLDGAFAVAADGGLTTVSLSDPFALSVKLGLVARLRAGAFAFWMHPNIRVALTAREVDVPMGGTVSFNQERVHLPFWFGFRVTPELSAGLELGIRGFTSGFGDNFETPVALGVNLGLSETLGIGATFGFETLLDHGTGDGKAVTFDRRSLTITVTSRI